ncbi:MAG: 4Fe-4S dicluster domain-containing protein [Deltaproteobacteria bacterium]|nr:4Fe-4S dicluster domain-containing protein [Deltaproteobacteria bacterium]
MKITLSKDKIESEGIALIERISGEDLKQCYQCGNCSGGCPVSLEMEITPSQMIRQLQLGNIEGVEEANTMWLCLGCQQCYSRCPKSVSAAKILEALRQLHLRKGEDHAEIAEMDMPLLKRGPQQAMVSAFRKFVS